MGGPDGFAGGGRGREPSPGTSTNGGGGPMQPAMETPFPGPGLLDAIRRALENKDLEAFARVYAEDAVLEEMSSLSPPTHPTVVRGREAIRKRFEDEILRDPVSGWSRQVRSSVVIDEMETADAVAFTEVRTYVAGDKVVALHFARKRDGQIEHDRLVIAWDSD
jgi:ketosteroid isomerase-like protein